MGNVVSTDEGDSYNDKVVSEFEFNYDSNIA